MLEGESYSIEREFHQDKDKGQKMIDNHAEAYIVVELVSYWIHDKPKSEEYDHLSCEGNFEKHGSPLPMSRVSLNVWVYFKLLIITVPNLLGLIPSQNSEGEKSHMHAPEGIVDENHVAFLTDIIDFDGCH